jgi:hypothetical protein
MQQVEETGARYQQNLDEGNRAGATYWKGENEKWRKQYDCNCKRLGYRTLKIRISTAATPRPDYATLLFVMSQILNAMRSFARCCVSVDMTLNPTRIPAGAHTGGFAHGHYAPDLVALAGHFDTAGGNRVPVIINDSVMGTGGITLASRYDAAYAGPTGAVVPQLHAPAFALAHELGHVAGLEHGDDQGDKQNLMGGGPNVSAKECTALRTLAAGTK